MCSLLRRIPAIGTLSSLHPMAPVAAHEDHAHVFTGIPLWQIAAGAGLAVAAYFTLMAWRKRRKGRPNKH
jgi:hypothetical protein